MYLREEGLKKRIELQEVEENLWRKWRGAGKGKLGKRSGETEKQKDQLRRLEKKLDNWKAEEEKRKLEREKKPWKNSEKKRGQDN